MSFLGVRLAATLATILVALSLAGCGGGSEGSAFTETTCPSGTSPTLAGSCLANGAMTAQKAAITTAVPQSGIWWNQAESGRGYVVEVQGDTLVLGAYMYTPDTKPVWYSGALQRSADGTYSGSLIRFAGGQTISSGYQAPTSSAPVATALFSATSATSASLMLTVNGATSVIPIEKFVFGSGPSTASFQGGMWWNPAESGRGFVIEAQGNMVAVASYMYDGTGDPVWYLTLGPLTSNNSVSGEMETYAGGQTLGGTYKAPVKTEGPGALRFEATSSTTATLTLPGGKSDPQVVKLERFMFGNNTDPNVLRYHEVILANSSLYGWYPIKLTLASGAISGDVSFAVEKAVNDTRFQTGFFPLANCVFNKVKLSNGAVKLSCQDAVSLKRQNLVWNPVTNRITEYDSSEGAYPAFPGDPTWVDVQKDTAPVESWDKFTEITAGWIANTDIDTRELHFIRKSDGKDQILPISINSVKALHSFSN